MNRLISCVILSLTTFLTAGAQEVIPLPVSGGTPGETPPIWVTISGISGEALQTLHFDLYVQGFNFTNADAAQYLIAGSNNGNFQGRVTDRYNKSSVVSKAYSGSSLRTQVHSFVDDLIRALKGTPICRTRIAFKGETGGN